MKALNVEKIKMGKTIEIETGEFSKCFKCLKYWKNRCNFTLRWLLDLGNTSLKQKLRQKTLGYLLFIRAIFFICCLAAPWPIFGYYRANSFTHPMLITAFGPSVFGPELDWEGLGFSKMWKCPQYRKQV